MRYLDGTLIRCSLEDGLAGASHCTDFQLPYARFNTNTLCALDGLGRMVATRTLHRFRLAAGWAEELAVTFWQCAFTSHCTLSQFAKDSATAALAAFNDNACVVEEGLIRAAGLVTSLLSPVFQIMYELSTIPVVRHTDVWRPDSGAIAAAHYSCKAAALPDGSCRGDAVTATHCVTRRPVSNVPVCVDVCAAATKSSECAAPCVWLPSGDCARPDDAWMAYQSHPLEASLITFAVSLANTVMFYPMHMTINTVDTIVGVFTKALPLPQSQTATVTATQWVPVAAPPSPPFLFSSPPPPPFPARTGGNFSAVPAPPAPFGPPSTYGASATAKAQAQVDAFKAALRAQADDLAAAAQQAAIEFGRSVTNMSSTLDRAALQTMPRIIATRAIKNMILPARDVMYGFYELVRAAVYVDDPADLGSGGFVAFTNTLRDTFNLCELVMETLTEALIDIIQTMVRIVMDAVLVLIDTPRILAHLKDIVEALLDLLLEAWDLLSKNLAQFFFQLPGMDHICSTFINPIIGFVNQIMTQICGVLHRLNSWLLNPLGLSIPTGWCASSLPELCNPDWFKVKPAFVFEASTCINDNDCRAGANCAVDSFNTSCKYSGWTATQRISSYQYVQPCACDDFSDLPAREPFCNVATGFCEEGPTFLGPPLTECPAAGGLAFTGIDYAHALCYTMPTWRCGTAARAAFFHDDPVAAVGLARTGDPERDLQACRFALANATWSDGTPRYLQGPFVCADACAPSALNAGNRLTLLTAGDATACVCEVGIQVRGRPPLTPPKVVDRSHALV